MNENLAFTIGNGDGFEEAVVSESSDIKTTSLEGELTKESSEMESMQDTAKAVGDPEEGLPPAVTEEPQSPEHIDLRKVKPYQKWLNAYLDVSDDQGEFLRDNTLEADVKVLCDELDSLELGEGSDLNALIELVREILIRYASTVNLSENVSIGMITKYRIRQGMLLRHQKKLVTEGLGENWIEWFKKHYDSGLLRSYQDYMRIAGVQNPIKYAVFGKERLLGIIRQLQNTDGDDPIGDFLADNGLDFAVEVETDPE